MGLVDYSDSEASENETPSAAPPSTHAPPAPAPAKPAFQKVVNAKGSGKIAVSLPAIKDDDGAPASDNGEVRPAKRARTGGAFSGFGAMLPAPKKAGASKPVAADGGSGAGGVTSGSAKGIGTGVNLRTGAAPAFSREALAVEPLAHDGLEANDEPKQEEVKLVGRPMMFKPLSVSRNGPAKKKKKLPMGDAETKVTAVPSTHKTQTDTNDVPPAAKKEEARPKISLFSAGVEEPVDVPEPTYEETEAVDGDEAYAKHEETPAASNTPAASTATPGNTTDLQALANTLNLSAAERRQLFGRNGPTQAQVAQFSLAAEYAHNQKVAADEAAAPAHNPVRSIAPGKHSLQQLVNAAASQKDALEESFAQGRRNKADAGSRYGW